MTRKPAAMLLVLSLAVVALVLLPAASLAAKGGNAGGKGNAGGNDGAGATSTPSTDTSASANGPAACAAPGVSVDNNWAWGSSGSYGMPGQQLMYSIQVTGGCGSSPVSVGVSAPSGFSVSMPKSTLTLKSGTPGYLTAYVTSPSSAADGRYPLTVTATQGTSSGSTTSYYLVYSSDSVAPTLFWENPWDGQALSGRSFNVTVASSDDHAVKKVDLYIDGSFVTTKACDDVTYICQLYYTWSLRRVRGQHTVTFKSTDWMGNEASLTSRVTVG